GGRPMGHSRSPMPSRWGNLSLTLYIKPRYFPSLLAGEGTGVGRLLLPEVMRHNHRTVLQHGERLCREYANTTQGKVDAACVPSGVGYFAPGPRPSLCRNL